jgi:hypothetical protein
MPKIIAARQGRMRSFNARTSVMTAPAS